MDYEEISSSLETSDSGSSDSNCSGSDSYGSSGSTTTTQEGEDSGSMESGCEELVSDLPPVPYHQGGSSTERNQEIWRGTQVDRNMRGRAPGWESASSSFYGSKRKVSLKDTDRPGYSRGEFQSPPRKTWKLSGNQGDKEESGLCNKEGEISSSWRYRSQGRLGEKGLSVPTTRGGDTWWKNPYRHTENVPVGILFEEEGDRGILPRSSAVNRAA